MGGFVSKVTDAIGITNYGDQAKATKNATNQQMAATREEIAAFEKANADAAARMQPYEDFGKAPMSLYSQLMTPAGNADFYQNNPILRGAINDATRTATARFAAGGKANSGGLIQALTEKNSVLANSMLGDTLNRYLQPITIGENAAARTGAAGMSTAGNVAGVLGNQGDILSAGTMARQNINNSALSGGTNMLFGSYMGGMNGGQALGSAGTSSMFANAGLGALLFSDERLKEDIERVGETDDGIPIYRWKYKGDNQVHIGPMAQDVEKVKPHAVMTHKSGYKVLNLEAI